MVTKCKTKHNNNSHFMGIIETACVSQKPPWKILLEESYTAYMPLLMESNAFGLEEDARVFLNAVTYTFSTL